MRRSPCIASVLGLVWLAGGCDGGGSIDPAQACTSAATAYCQKIKACASFFFDATWESETACAARIKADCVSDLGAEGNSQKPADLDACAAALGAVACADLFSDNLPAACTPKAGPQANGTACGVDGQCQSTYCKLNEGTCGVCAPQVAGGGACMADDDCTAGLVCAASTCKMPAALGAVCDASRPCRQDLVCRSGTCGMPKGAGEACVQNQSDCDPFQGLWCNPVTGVCQRVELAAPGETCGAVGCQPGGSACNYVVCRSSGHCRITAGMSSGACLAAAPDGAACDENEGPSCIPPAECVAGACKLSDPALCK